MSHTSSHGRSQYLITKEQKEASSRFKILMDIAYNLRSKTPKYYAFSVSQKRFDDAGARPQKFESSQEEQELREALEKKRAKNRRKKKRTRRKKREMPLHLRKQSGSHLDDFLKTKADIPGAGSYDLPPLPLLGAPIGFTEEMRLREDADSTWYGVPQVNEYKKVAKFADPEKLHSNFVNRFAPSLLSEKQY
eukprot:gb/GECG01003366.1/.p1 GENE.gb/GECG01003366.1/~~gb/GECG01003366.1/.p1  ORF type:complete len:192 (+),score=28.20 gb/GECG01003366.1/:1-576(+)